MFRGPDAPALFSEDGAEGQRVSHMTPAAEIPQRVPSGRG